MRASFAENDPDPEARRAWVGRQRADYRYNHDYLPPVCVMQDLPRAERFTAAYYAKRLVQTRALLVNSPLAWLLAKLSTFGAPQDLERLFFTLPRPRVIEDWRSDESFARQRLAGPNPMRIRRVLHPDELPFRVGTAGLGEAIPDGSLTVEDAVKSGTLYLTDYASLSSIPGGTYGGVQRSMPAPRALFHLTQSGGLQPVAIELRPGGTVRTPSTTPPLDWLAAKIWLQIADANDLELGSHLAQTHLVMQPFGMATPRQLGESHPVAILLRPHLRFMLANTRLGRRILLAPGSLADQLCAGSLPGSRDLVVDSYKRWSLTENAFPSELAARNLDDAQHLPNFAYREDGQLLWAAIREYVTSYLELYYAESGDVVGDRELQSWAAELASSEGGRVKDMPERIESREQLRDILTTVLFTCGPQHAVVNYGQYEFLSFVSNMPLAAYCDLDPEHGPVSFERESDLMRLLPPDDSARRQIEVMSLLSAYHHDRLGHYPRGHFSDAAALEVIERFQQRLEEIGTTIEERNRERRVPYEFMKPSQVPNSISI
jgi:arachidonate 15-lipoxygenase